MEKTLLKEKESSFTQLFSEVDILENDEILLIKGGISGNIKTENNTGIGCHCAAIDSQE